MAFKAVGDRVPERGGGVIRLLGKAALVGDDERTVHSHPNATSITGRCRPASGIVVPAITLSAR
jgi:hypothetical protein